MTTKKAKKLDILEGSKVVHVDEYGMIVGKLPEDEGIRLKRQTFY